MCLGGHLAYRCALDSRVKAAVCYFATDIHSKTLAQGKNDDSLARTGDIKGELLMVSILFLFLFWIFLRSREDSWGINSISAGTDLHCQIFGKNDTHVPPEGRDLIRKTLHEKGVLFSFYEIAWAQRAFPSPWTWI